MSTSQNHNQKGRPNKKHKGTKRNASDLLPTSNKDTNNPRAAKRQRTGNDRYEATLHAILTMSESEVNVLPQSLRKQAIALRSDRNISNPSNNRNNNHSNHRNNNNNPPMPQIIQHETLMELSDDDSTDDEDEPQPHNHYTSNNHKTKIQRPYFNPNHQNNHPQPQPIPNTSHNPPYIHHSNPIRAPAIRPSVAIRTSIPPQQPTNISSQRIPLNYNRPQTVLNPPQQRSSIGVPRYYNAQELMSDDKTRKCCSICGLFYIILFCLFMAPFLMAIPVSHSFGSNYCDTNASIIRAYNEYNCIECPLNAKYCIKGSAFCGDLSYFVDTQRNECVKRSYSLQVMNGYKDMYSSFVVFMNGIKNGMMNYYDVEMTKWQSVKEWKEWFNVVSGLSFVEFCVFYEMEVMVSFFVLTWYLPMFRCFIVFLWTRMILPTLDGGSDKLIVIYLKLLSYFAPILFIYQIWNKIAEFMKKSW